VWWLSLDVIPLSLDAILVIRAVEPTPISPTGA